ncbi:MAG: class I SAM-dependent methyltransferase [Opitutus sp.]|nr:class I SAM-dependent methyltransferase [Opitutus sp.]
MNQKNTPATETSVSERVHRQYTGAPFPPVSFFPVVPGPPAHRIWLYSFTEVYYHAFRRLRNPAGARLLDAGCGTGIGVHQIRHLAPGAEVHAFDFSRESLAIARQRIDALGGEPVTFHELDLMNLRKLPGKFDAIFCSGVIHHTADPVRALRELKSKLKPDGVIYLMLYSQFGRRPSMLMQRAIKLLSRNPQDQQEGLQVGRKLFDALPATNPIATWEREKWGGNHRTHPEAFIDMYVNANEKNYSIREVYADLAAAGLQFLRFDKPQLWQLRARMTLPAELQERFQALPALAQYEVIENLFPDRDQYMFVATHGGKPPQMPEWFVRRTLAGLENRFTATRSTFISEINPTPPQPGFSFWSGYFEVLTQLDAHTRDLLCRCDGTHSVGEIVAGWEQAHGAPVQGRGAEFIRMLEARGLVYLSELAPPPSLVAVKPKVVAVKRPRPTKRGKTRARPQPAKVRPSSRSVRRKRR